MKKRYINDDNWTDHDWYYFKHARSNLSSTLKDCSFELKLLLDSIDTEGELQDSFLEFIEARDNNS